MVGGCATKPVAKPGYSFFPAAPDEPKVQFLTSFSSEADLGWRNKMAEFVTGKAPPQNPLVKPYGIAVRDGKIFVCDTMVSAVEVFDLANKKSSYFTPAGEGRLKTPINITIDTDGTRYVADTGRGQVIVYGSSEDYIAAIGEKDEIRPSDVAITADRLYITDLKGHAVRVYSKADRKLLFTIPRDKAAAGKLLSPTNLGIDSNGQLIVSDTGAFAIQCYDLEGKHLRTVGQQGAGPGMFARPKGVAVDRSGRSYVVDAATQVVQVFDGNGKLLMFFGQPQPGMRGALNLPATVKVDYDSVPFFQNAVAPGYECEFLIFVTNQLGPEKVSIYGFIHKAKGQAKAE